MILDVFFGFFQVVRWFLCFSYNIKKKTINWHC